MDSSSTEVGNIGSIGTDKLSKERVDIWESAYIGSH